MQELENDSRENDFAEGGGTEGRPDERAREGRAAGMLSSYEGGEGPARRARGQRPRRRGRREEGSRKSQAVGSCQWNAQKILSLSD